MARFFIDRPIFAWVIAIMISLAGIVSVVTLPLEQYPDIAPPTVSVNANYPGASAETVQNSVTQIIEQQMTGLDHLLYMSSSSSSAGSASLTLTFDSGTDPDTAQVQVQNKVALAIPSLPLEVQQQGVQVNKSVRNFLIVVGLISRDGSMSNTDLADYNASVMRDPISRLQGVGEIQAFGTQYAMRIWLDPDKLNKYQLTSSDIILAVRAQNAQVSAGALGGLPAVQGQLLNATVMAQSRLQTPEQFGDILLRVSQDGSRVFLRDVARVELGSESYNVMARYNGMPASGMAIRPALGANALETVDIVKKKVAELSQFFPPGVEAIFPYDTTQFVRISVEEVVKTLIEAVILVFVVMFVFLQSWRATLIPTIAVPVVLLGTFGVMSAAGYSINTLTLFGLVLAIGLLVDDAIVVVENVERVMQEEGLPPKEATRKSMDQISGALVGIGLVLSAAFVPMAFFTGSSGVIYRQFSLIIVSSVALSVLVALILTPALCATLLKPVPKDHGINKRGPFGWFNRAFERTADGYTHAVAKFLKHYVLALIPYAAIAVAVVLLFERAPTGFLPDEDTGVLFAMAQLPPGSTREQADEVLKKMEHHFFEEEKDLVEGGFGVLGFSFSGNAQNQVLMFVKLKPWEDRKLPEQKVKAIQMRALGKFGQIKEALAFAFAPPAVLELGTATGFDMRLVDLGGLGHDALMEAQGQLLGMAAKNPVLTSVRPNGLADTSVYQIDVDKEKASALGLSLSEINASLSTVLGSTYINDFIDKNRVKRVMIQGDAPFRMLPEDISRWYVRNAQGGMVPFSAFSTGSWKMGSPKLERFNGSSSLSIQGEPAAGHSSGEAIQEIEKIVKSLPSGIGVAWAGLSYEEQMSGSKASSVYIIALLMVFLCLAALYESWAIPFSVMMDMPLGALGVVAATQWRGMPNDIYFQIGLITIIGLSAKNAILVVEFAKEHFDQGATLIDAALHAVRQRLRPILMTSIAFGLGVLPLAINSGAGSGSQNAIGTGIVGGAVTTTLLGLFFVPLYFVVILRLFRVKPLKAQAK